MNKTKYPDIDMVERMNEAFKQSGITQRELARRTHLDRKTIYAYLIGDWSPSALALARICLALNVSADWLLFGKGETPWMKR